MSLIVRRAASSVSWCHYVPCITSDLHVILAFLFEAPSFCRIASPDHITARVGVLLKVVLAFSTVRSCRFALVTAATSGDVAADKIFVGVGDGLGAFFAMKVHICSATGVDAELGYSVGSLIDLC